MKQDEIDFLKKIFKNGGKIPSEYWPEITKREYYFLDKWSKKGYWEYGVSSRGGWMTEEGFKKAAGLE